MRSFATLTAAALTTAALLWGSASFASGYDDVITQAFTAAGYSNVQVSRSGSEWVVVAQTGGRTMQFVVDPNTGRSRPRGNDGVGHDVGDDHGVHGAGHDLNDDHGGDGAGHDVGDDHGVHGAGHDLNDDHGGDGAGHDLNDDHGGDRDGHDQGDDHGHDGNHHGGGDHEGGENEGHGNSHD